MIVVTIDQYYLLLIRIIYLRDLECVKLRVKVLPGTE